MVIVPRHGGHKLVEAPGIENESGRTASTIPQRKGTIRHEREPGSEASRASECAIASGVGTESSQAPSGKYELRDVVEPALARALVLAAEARRWDVVIQIATELGARRAAAGAGAPKTPSEVRPFRASGRAPQDSAESRHPTTLRSAGPVEASFCARQRGDHAFTDATENAQ
jgi:hypothetical protein